MNVSGVCSLNSYGANRAAFCALALVIGACTQSRASREGAPHEAKPRLATVTSATAAGAQESAPLPSSLPPAVDELAQGMSWRTREGESHFSPSGPGVVVSSHGVVTSVEEQATRAGIEVLSAGGNAVDAAVATALALAVTHPSAGNLGGGGFALMQVDGKVFALDFRESSPLALTDDLFWKMIKAGGRTWGAVGVPGTPAGLFEMHRRFGRLEFKDLCKPAERLARDGFTVGKRQADVLRWSRYRLIKSPRIKATFYPREKTPKAGQRLKRARLAEALRIFGQQGKSAFYGGVLREDILASQSAAGLLSEEDFQQYGPIWRKPLHYAFAGADVMTMPAPSAGGVALAQSLLMLDELNVLATKPMSVERIHLIAEVQRRAQAERRLFVTAPERLSASERAKASRRALSADTWLQPHPIVPNRATDPATLSPLYAASLKELEHTTHLSVIDSEGGAVSMTVTLSGGYGIGDSTERFGLVMNNSVGSYSSVGVNVPAPGKRTTSSMAPTLLKAPGDQSLLFALGSPGGDTIPSTLTQVILHLAEGASLNEAVVRPRFHQAFVPDELLSERPRPLPPAALESLKQMGHAVGRKRLSIGDANIAARRRRELRILRSKRRRPRCRSNEIA